MVMFKKKLLDEIKISHTPITWYA